MTATVTMSIRHIDTCLPSYLQDHHNRPREHLLGVPVDGTTTWGEVREGIQHEWAHGKDLDLPNELWKQAEEAFIVELASEFETVDMDKLFDSSLDVPNEDAPNHGESVYAWFLVTYSVDGEA